MSKAAVHIRVGEADFDVGAETAAIQGHSRGIGGLASFIGVMRDFNEGSDVKGMLLEHYPGMTEKALAGIVDEATRRWALEGVTLIHRVGTLKPGDQIVLVLTAAAHRGEAFSACEFIMDYLKTRAPFWKKELTVDGERWVDARLSDDEAAERWR